MFADECHQVAALAAGRDHRESREQPVAVVFVAAESAEEGARAVENVDAVALGGQVHRSGGAQRDGGFEGRIGLGPGASQRRPLRSSTTTASGLDSSSSCRTIS